MKIIAIARNYAEHAREMNHKVPNEPVVFLKPQNALLANGEPFYYPDFTKELHYEAEMVLKISANGKYIDPKFSHKYYNEVTIGIDMTARDLQRKCKEQGWPWEISKSFDQSAVVGKFIPKSASPLGFSLKQNGKTVQEGNTGNMIFPVDFLISYVSRFFTLNAGDLLFTGTPEGVGEIKIGDRLEGYIGGEKLLDCTVS